MFYTFINDICAFTHNSDCLLFADVFRRYRGVTNIEDCTLLQCDVGTV
jgi:hypothetical protein